MIGNFLEDIVYEVLVRGLRGTGNFILGLFGRNPRTSGTLGDVLAVVVGIAVWLGLALLVVLALLWVF